MGSPNSIEHWNVFDAVCVTGRHCRLKAGGLYSAEHLLGEMDQLGIAEALVVDSLSREIHPVEGNARILNATRAHPRLHPAWAALPPGAPDEQPDPERLLREMRENQVGALFLFHGQYHFNLSDWCVDALLEPLADARAPVFLNPNDGMTVHHWDHTDWDAVVDLCRRWPALPVIAGECRIRRGQRMIYRALDACENLRIELSGYWLHRGVEYIARRWGAHRLIFGSNWPVFGQGSTLAMLTCAEIDDEDKRKIAGDNLRNLLAWSHPHHPQVRIPPPADEYVRFGRTGKRPESMRFLDCHGHFGGRFSHYHLPDSDLASTIAEMDRLGIEKVCLFSFSGVHGDEVFGNNAVAEALARHPERFIGFALVNPHRGREEMLAELERCARLGFRGVKLIPHYQGYPETGPDIEVACQWAHERRQFILNHYWGPADHLERLLSAYPDACFIAGHTTVEYAEIMKRHENLFVCSVVLLGPRDCEDVAAAIGADRFLFGSDLQDLPISWGLGPILFSRLSADEKAKILGGNLQRLCERYSRRD
jgi:predicted TIM-barrel fold metal-dependent hydrolase